MPIYKYGHLYISKIRILFLICIFVITPLKMLPKANRLTKKKDFNLVFKKGESVKNGFLIFKMFKNNLKESRFGFVVSKKISNKATVRNKIKRRLRDAVFTKLKIIKKPTDVIIICLSGIEKKEFSEIQEMVNNSLKKLRLI